jgi:sRNA-binding regulator protein Hfq
MEKDLKKADVRVKILAWEGSEKEKNVFKWFAKFVIFIKNDNQSS